MATCSASSSRSASAGSSRARRRVVLLRDNGRSSRADGASESWNEPIAAARPALARAGAAALYKLGELPTCVCCCGRAAVGRDPRLPVRERARAARQGALRGFRADSWRGVDARELREGAARRRSLSELARTRSAGRRRKKKSELLTCAGGEKGSPRRLPPGAEDARREAHPAPRRPRQREVSLPIAAFRGTLLWPVIGPVRTTFGRTSTRSSRPTPCTTASRSRPPPRRRWARFTRETWCSPTSSAATVSWWWWTTATSTTPLYAHLAEARVATGQRVAAGELVGTVGATSLGVPGLYLRSAARAGPRIPRNGCPGTSPRINS